MAEPQFTQAELKQEEWQPVHGWEGIYSVSSLGRVRRDIPGNGTIQGRILRLTPGQKSYVSVTLKLKPRSQILKVHRLVCLAFHGPCPLGHQVNHINGKKSDNRAPNLEWVTPAENVRHAHDVLGGNRCYPRGEGHPMHKLTENEVREVRERCNAGQSDTEVAAALNVTRPTVWGIRTGHTWKHVI